MRNIVACGRYLCIAEGKKKDTIPASNLWMVSFFWNGLHAIQVVLHYIKQVAGLQFLLLHQSSQSFCGIAVICNIRNSLLQLPAVFGKIAFTHDTIATVAAQLRVGDPFFVNAVADGLCSHFTLFLFFL